MGRTDDDRVVDDDRRRAVADARVIRFTAAHAREHVDDAALTEARHGASARRVEREQLEPRRHADQPIVAGAVGPVGQAPARVLARRPVESVRVFLRPPYPERLTGFGIDRDDVARDARGRIQHTANHQRRRLVLGFRSRPEVAALPAPGNAQVGHIARVDLIERRIAMRGEVAAVVAPFDHPVEFRAGRRRVSGSRCFRLGGGPADVGDRLVRRRASGRSAGRERDDERAQHWFFYSGHGGPCSPSGIGARPR